jgi:hypothetical protein
MDAIFDDLSQALRAPRVDVWRPVRVIALDLARKLLIGLAICLSVCHEMGSETGAERRKGQKCLVMGHNGWHRNCIVPQYR